MLCYYIVKNEGISTKMTSFHTFAYVT